MKLTNQEAVQRLEMLYVLETVQEGTQGFKEALEMGVAALNEQRPHGKWLLKTDYFGRGYYECSVCKAEQKQHFVEFCGRCGADMREKGGEIDEHDK